MARNVLRRLVSISGFSLERLRLPHAALLLADYLLGPEGQGVLEKYHYGNAAKNYGFKRWRPEHGMSLAKYEKELERWEKVVRDIGRK